jgi:hypothetical protein
MKFRKLNFQKPFEYRSDSNHILLAFYNEVFPMSKKVASSQESFNSKAFRVLSKSFTEFINTITSAYLRIMNQNSGVYQNYILNITTCTRNLNRHKVGLYSIVLVCESEIIDVKTFIKQ